jgi:hypothetical protein
MNITTVQEKERVMCEPSYYKWWQNCSPSFKDVLEKVCKECGSSDPPTFDDDTSTVISCTIHGVEITIVKNTNLNPNLIKTKMRCKTAKHDWISLEVQESNLYIPYFQTFLSNLRNVWYQQYRVDIGV